MSLAEPVRVLRSVPGRARVHLAGWSGADPQGVADRLTPLAGVESVRADVRTRNVLVHFDPQQLDEERLVAALAQVVADVRAVPQAQEVEEPRRAVARRRGRRARIAMHGLDRTPELARVAIERLEAMPEVERALASPLTGRVLVELAGDAGGLDEVLAVIGELEAPYADSEPEFPAHPLDPAPAIEGAARMIGAGLGLALLAGRRIAGATGPPTARAGPGEAAALLSTLEGFPPVVDRIEELFGHERKELLFGAVSVVGLTFSGGAWGLLLAGARGLRLFTEARARRQAFVDYQRRTEAAPPAHPGARLHLVAGARLPLPATVVEGFGTAAGDDGRPVPVRPGARVEAGARLAGGPVEVELEAPAAFEPVPRPAPAPPTPIERYVASTVRASLGQAALTGIITRSPARVLRALLLLNPHAALVGGSGADLGANARALRCGATVVGSRSERTLALPDVMLLAGARTLTDGLEVGGVASLDDDLDTDDVLRLAGLVSAAAGSPWGAVLRPRGALNAQDGTFDGAAAGAEIDGVRWTVAPVDDAVPAAVAARAAAGDVVLALRRQPDPRPLGVVTLRPRLADASSRLIAVARRHRVRLAIAAAADTAAGRDLARRAGLPFHVTGTDGVGLADRVRRYQEAGEIVAVVGDGAGVAAAFDAADLAIGLTSGRSGRFQARADVLAPSLDVVAELLETGAKHDAAQRDSAALAVAGNVAGGLWAVRAGARFASSGRPATLAALAATADGWARLWGGHTARSVSDRLADPMPERWGREPAGTALRLLESTPRGLATDEARARFRPRTPPDERRGIIDGLADQLSSPLALMLVAGAGLALATGALADVGLIAAVLAANAATGAWQEQRAGAALAELESLTAGVATVLRDDVPARVPTSELVHGDVLLLGAGDRVPADARVLTAEGLEVDEAALTGESLPVAKSADNGTDASRILLEGSDVTSGRGNAVIVAVGAETRLGATAAALAGDERPPSALEERLRVIVARGLPLMVLSGAALTALGVLRGRPLVPQLALGASLTIAAVPEGLPLLAGIAEAGVARRLAPRRALVSRLSAVEALGRVDVACADKTGTLTEGRLAVTRVVDTRGRSAEPEQLDPALSDVLVGAALASPHPDAPDAAAHPTDVAVLDAAARAGLGARVRIPRDARAAFDPTRAFHAEVAGSRLHVKGAAEVLVDRCAAERVDGRDLPLDDDGRHALLEGAHALAREGLRVLMVAEGEPQAPDSPHDLTAVGFVAISDPLRETVPAAIERCHAAGVHVLMITGDHPETARAVAAQAGLSLADDGVLVGSDITALTDDELRARLEHATVVARTTPLDKVRIIEALQQGGHVVAMTGDGVNDAPALRLADVGVAIGERSTEVARQTADLIVTDGDFSTLVEALVEGRSFWHNMRRSLGLLLGGNAGEVGLVLLAAAVGLPVPLTTRQILTVNVATDVLPAVAIALQHPEHRNLAELAREGGTALDKPLRNEIVRRAVATGLPSFGAYVLASRRGGRDASSVAFASIVTTQLAQTLDMGRADGRLPPMVLAAVAASLGLTAAALTVPGLRGVLGLALPGPDGLLIIGGATATAVAIARVAGGRPAA